MLNNWTLFKSFDNVQTEGDRQEHWDFRNKLELLGAAGNRMWDLWFGSCSPLGHLLYRLSAHPWDKNSPSLVCYTHWQTHSLTLQCLSPQWYDKPISSVLIHVNGVNWVLLLQSVLIRRRQILRRLIQSQGLLMQYEMFPLSNAT